MKEDAVLLLDTHIWFWWVSQNDRLPNSLQTLISQFDGRVSVSAASVYELTVLAMRKRIVLNRELDDWIDRATQGVALILSLLITLLLNKPDCCLMCMVTRLIG